MAMAGEPIQMQTDQTLIIMVDGGLVIKHFFLET